MGLTRPLESFTTLLQRGHFSPIYARERQIAARVDSYYYKKAVIDNANRSQVYKSATRGQATVGGKSNNPLSRGVDKSDLNSYEMIEEETLSMKTLECSMNEEGEEQDEKNSVMNQSVQQPESPRLGKREPLYTALETGSNASRAGDVRPTSGKVGKNNILTIKPSTPEWIANFRVQEKERYKNPTIAWNYTMPDGNK